MGYSSWFAFRGLVKPHLDEVFALLLGLAQGRGFMCTVCSLPCYSMGLRAANGWLGTLGGPFV
jgi:hypothetical protein